MQDLTRVTRTLCRVNIFLFEVGSQQWGRCGGVWQFVWVLQWIPRNDVIDLFWCLCCWLLTYFARWSCAPVVEFCKATFYSVYAKKYVMLKIDSEWYHVSKRRAHTHTHTRTHTETYTHIYTYTHTHTYINWI